MPLLANAVESVCLSSLRQESHGYHHGIRVMVKSKPELPEPWGVVRLSSRYIPCPHCKERPAVWFASRAVDGKGRIQIMTWCDGAECIEIVLQKVSK